MKRSFLFIFFIIVIQFSCKEDGISPPPKTDPPGLQQDIQWPTLANSPWPTDHGDMQRTGRSKYSGPQQGIVFAKVRAPQMQTGVVFANDSVFYYGTSNRFVDTTKLVAAKIDGTILWSLDLQALETTTTPLVDENGTIYIANGYYRQIYAVNPDGTVKWVLPTAQEVFNRGLGMGKDGTLYAIENGSTLYAINRDGTIQWQMQDNNFGVGYRVSLPFSPDGNTMYIHGNRIGNEKITLLAFDIPTRTIKWKFGHELLANGPMVDSQGNIYVLIEDDTLDNTKANFYCLTPDGTIKWKYSHSRGPIYWDIDPTIDKEGNIYFATDTLYALDYSGSLRWKIGLGGAFCSSPLVCDSEGNVYAATFANFFDGLLYAVTKEGVVKWTLQINDERAPGHSPAITQNGTLVFPSWRSENLWIIK